MLRARAKLLNLVRKWATTSCHSLDLVFYSWTLFLGSKRTSSCILCHHSHEKGPSKNIFLSFQAISLIPDELQGRGKHYGCGLAGGGEGILWVEHQCVCVPVCAYVWTQIIWIHLHHCEVLFNDWTFFIFVFLFGLVFVSVCTCVYVWIFGYEAATRASVPPRRMDWEAFK